MRNLTLTDLQRVVALGGGHGLGRVMSSLSFLGSRLTGIVTTTDNGGSTGRIRRSEGGIAWGDTRNCLNQLITTPSTASAMFEYRFGGSGELAGHNLGNLMLKALDNLSVRPLEAINLIRNLLQIDAELIPMSEQSADLLATDAQGLPVYGEVAVDQLATLPQDLRLFPAVTTTREAVDAIANADLLLIGPGSFLTSLMPLLLLEDLTAALHHSNAPMVYIANLDQELSPAASQLTVSHQIEMIESKVGRRMIDAVILAPQMNTASLTDRLVVQQPLAAADVPHHHDRQLLREAIAQTQRQLALNLHRQTA